MLSVGPPTQPLRAHPPSRSSHAAAAAEAPGPIGGRTGGALVGHKCMCPLGTLATLRFALAGGFVRLPALRRGAPSGAAAAHALVALIRPRRRQPSQHLAAPAVSTATGQAQRPFRCAAPFWQAPAGLFGRTLESRWNRMQYAAVPGWCAHPFHGGGRLLMFRGVWRWARHRGAAPSPLSAAGRLHGCGPLPHLDGGGGGG